MFAIRRPSSVARRPWFVVGSWQVVGTCPRSVGCSRLVWFNVFNVFNVAGCYYFCRLSRLPGAAALEQV